MRRLCSFCSKAFTPNKHHPRQKFCSSNCCKKSWTAQNPERRRAQAKEWARTHPPTKEKRKRYRAVENRKRRREVIDAYGGPSCVCDHNGAHCGLKPYEFLAFDHINGEGKIGNRSTNPYMLKKLGYPPYIRVLCHNCNSALGFYGYCPLSETERQVRKKWA